MNKKISLMSAAVALMALLRATIAQAVPLTFYEQFLGSTSDGCILGVCVTPYAVSLSELWTAELSFDLTASGDSVTVSDGSGATVYSAPPTVDETKFVPNAFSLTDALLSFVFYSADFASETIQIRTSALDGSQMLFDKTFYLPGLRGPRVTFDFDLAAAGLLAAVADGKLDTLVLALETPWCNVNDFGIEQATLTAHGTPIPEPTTVLLLGLGLLGLPVARRLSAGPRRLLA